MAQLLRPTAPTVGNWRQESGFTDPALLAAAINEVVRNDENYIQGWGEQVFPIAPPADSPGPGTCGLRLVYGKPSGVAAEVELLVQVRQGLSVLAERVFSNISALTLAQIQFPRDLVSTWSNLNVRLVARFSTGSGGDDDAPPPTMEIEPGANLASVIGAAPEGAIIRIYGDTTYTTGEIRPPHGVSIWGDPVTRGPKGEVFAPTKIVGTGPNVFNLNNRDENFFQRLDVSGGVLQYNGGSPNGQTGNGFLQGRDAVLRLLKIHTTQKAGVSGPQRNMLVEDCEFTNNGTLQVSGLSAAFKTISFATLRNIYCHHNRYYGLWCDCQCPGWLLENILCEDDYGSSIFNEISIGPSIFRDVTVLRANSGMNNGRGGVVIASSENVLIERLYAHGSHLRDVWFREEERAGDHREGDPNYWGNPAKLPPGRSWPITTNCLRGERLSGIEMRDSNVGVLQTAYRLDNMTQPSSVVDHTVDQVIVHPIYGGGTITLENNTNAP